MALNILLETGFMLALNPRDEHHEWALKILKKSRGRANVLHISPVAPIELSLIMKSKGYSDKSILRVLNALHSIIRRYTRPYYPRLELEHVMYAAELRLKHPVLTFFDSIHASVAILNSLTYYDLDKTIRNVIDKELETE